MIIANILIAFFGLIGTLAAFGGDTWTKEGDSIIKRITKRGWLALTALFITFTIGIVKEVINHQDSIDDKANKERLVDENRQQREQLTSQLEEIKILQSKIDLQVAQTKILQSKLDSTSSNLKSTTEQIGFQQLGSIEAAFKLAILIPRETDDAVIHLNGQSNVSIPSKHFDQMQLYWGDEFHFVIFPESDNINRNDLENLKLKVGEIEYPLHNACSNGFFEETVRIYGRTPRPMIPAIYNPDRVRDVIIKIFVRTTDSSQGQEEFRKMILNSPFSEFAKKLYKRTTRSIVHVWANASESSHIRSSLAKGSFVRVLQTQEKWSEIMTPEGRQGWLLSENLGEIN